MGRFIGVLQTGDVDEAILTAEKYRAKGKPIMAKRVEFPLPERFFAEDPALLTEHAPIEYEVHVDFEPWRW